MAASSVCCIHVIPDKSGPVVSITQASFERIVECTDNWICGDGIQTMVALDLVDKGKKLIARSSGYDGSSDKNTHLIMRQTLDNPWHA